MSTVEVGGLFPEGRVEIAETREGFLWSKLGGMGWLSSTSNLGLQGDLSEGWHALGLPDLIADSCPRIPEGKGLL